MDDLPKYRERVQRVTPADIARVAKWFIRPAHLSVVLVGNADAFVNDLKGICFGEFERIPIYQVNVLAADFQRPTDSPARPQSPGW